LLIIKISCQKEETHLSNYLREYQSKLVSADEAVKSVKSGDWISYGSLNAQACCLDKALAKRKDELRDVKIWTLLCQIGRAHV
jgi:acyl-CoA hydrolase